MKNKLAENMNSYRMSFLFASTLLLTISGCVHPPPILLRSRPNVPPPLISPSKGNQIIATENIYNIDIPAKTSPEIITIPASLPPPNINTAPLTYTVKKGESFWKVARMYGVTQAELATCNNLSLKKTLRAGTELLIPSGGEFIPVNERPIIKKAAPPKKTAPPKKVVTRKQPDYVPTLQDGKYTVQPGDNLWKIARKFKTTTSLLMQANGLNSKSVLPIGKTLIIPGAGDTTFTPETQPPPTLENPTTETLDDPSIGRDADNLLNDAEKSTSSAPTSISTPEEDAGAVIDEMAEVQNVIDNSETPGSLYTEEVLPNETLQDIADRHGITPEDIRAVNPELPANGKLKPFTSIKIPNK